MFVQYNSNPQGSFVGDCVVRAISKALNLSWEKVYVDLAVQGLVMADMPSSNRVWSAYLDKNGYTLSVLPVNYSVKSFAQDYPSGVYILATGSHVVAVVDGDYYDTWDSGEETPIYYFKEAKNGV